MDNNVLIEGFSKIKKKLEEKTSSEDWHVSNSSLILSFI